MLQSSPERKPVPHPLNSDHHSAVLHSVLQQLDTSQWWSPAQLEQGAMQQLQRLLQQAKTCSPFYRQRLQHLDMANFGRANLGEIPVLTRAELQQANADIDADRLPPDHGVARETMTSGSTGEPVRIRGTGVTALLWNALNLREHLWQQRDTTKVNSSIRWRGDSIGKSDAGVALTGWGAPVNQFYLTAPPGEMATAPIWPATSNG